MSIKIKIPYTTSFKMPGMCISCSAPPDSPTHWNASKTQTVDRTAFTLTVPFPVCRECAAVGRDSEKGGRLGMAGLALAFFSLILVFAFVNKSTGSQATAILVAALAAIAIYAFFAWLKSRADQAGFTSTQRERRDKVKQSVEILFFVLPEILDKAGHIQFKFGNEAFAREFSARNEGKVE